MTQIKPKKEVTQTVNDILNVKMKELETEIIPNFINDKLNEQIRSLNFPEIYVLHSDINDIINQAFKTSASNMSNTTKEYCGDYIKNCIVSLCKSAGYTVYVNDETMHRDLTGYTIKIS